MNENEPAVPEQDTERPSTLEPGVLDAEIAAVIEKAQAEGLQLTGGGGLLPGMIKQAVKAAMNVELTDHLGYEPQSGVFGRFRLISPDPKNPL